MPSGRVRTSQSRVAVAVRDDVVEDSKTEETVQELNTISLEHFRCHSIGTDAAPDIDPFKLVADDIAPLSGRVAADLEAQEPILSASAQHFFGSGRTREGKRVRPVIVLLMGNVSLRPLMPPSPGGVAPWPTTVAALKERLAPLVLGGLAAPAAPRCLAPPALVAQSHSAHALRIVTRLCRAGDGAARRFAGRPRRHI
eukprot:4365601-Prymnesium_polylepis.2